MANQQPANPPAHPPAAAQVVGKAFVNQYYNVLHQTPQLVHRFYSDGSRMTRAEAGPYGAVDTVRTQREIYQKVMYSGMSSDYSKEKVEIKTVDSQDSHGGGVIILVTGALPTVANEKRDFVQSFFLAPQERGYVVLNDIFRFLDEDSPDLEDYLPERSTSLDNILSQQYLIVHQPSAPEPA